jgi:hypothetical protein
LQTQDTVDHCFPESSVTPNAPQLLTDHLSSNSVSQPAFLEFHIVSPIMATTSTPQGSLRQRNVGKKGAAFASTPEPEFAIAPKAKASPAGAGSERDHQAALTLITGLAFLTRFWGISHPNEVVFDEVHFGKVR